MAWKMERVRGLGWVGVVFAAALVSGCLSTSETLSLPTVGDPLIRSGLVLKINVVSPGKADEYVKDVSPAGELSLPLIGSVKCEGLKLAELQAKLTEVFATYIHEPSVTVQFIYGEGMQSPWGTVLVMGCVGRPGPVNIPPTRDLTVTRAIQQASGTTQLARLSKVTLTRKLADGKSKAVRIDLEEIGKRGLKDKDLVLQADDVIYVPETTW